MASRFNVIALVAARNENDIIEQVIEDLVRQNVQVYFIDDGSTDGTLQTVERWQDRGVIGIERRPDTEAFEWSAILRRKEELAGELDASWFIHHDADEFRQSPFPGVSLHDAIRQVDVLGYNAIDFRVLNFRPTTADHADVPGDVRAKLSYYEPAEFWETPQIKAWRKTSQLDLASSGGHQVIFDGRQVFPVQFLVRHYPIRSQSQGLQKVFQDRQPRFLPAEKAAGWHVQYDGLSSGVSFLRDPSTLTRFDEQEVLRDLRLTHRDTPSLVAAEARIVSLGAEVGRLAESRARLEETRNELDLERANAERDRAASAALRETEHAAFEELADRLRQHSSNLQGMLVNAGRSATDQADQHAAVIQHLRRELDALYSSKSWQVTRPLRWALGLVAGGAAAERSVSQEPARGPNWGELATVCPLSDVWGTDRGRPIDRYYIELFLERHASDIQGVVCEIKDPGYTKMFGASRVTESIVIDVDAANPLATLHADLTHSERLPAAAADCFILTQTIHIIYEYERALQSAMRILRPGGVLLCTVPALSRVNYENGGLETGDYWRFTAAALTRVMSGLENTASFKVETFGNVRTCAGFLYGLATEEMPQSALDFHDPWFPLIHGVRAVKAI